MPVFKPDGVGMLLDDDGGGRDGWFTPLLSCKTVLLPRQARDKHRESTQNKDVRAFLGWFVFGAKGHGENYTLTVGLEFDTIHWSNKGVWHRVASEAD